MEEQKTEEKREENRLCRWLADIGPENQATYHTSIMEIHSRLTNKHNTTLDTNIESLVEFLCRWMRIVTDFMAIHWEWYYDSWWTKPTIETYQQFIIWLFFV